ncbi:MAG: DNA alkylation repair protein, partial [Candidatus Helarchaeota archaeon]
MPSISSAKEIKKRALQFLENNIKLENIDDMQLEMFKNHVRKEYEMIPEKERIGKGLVYISRHIASALYKFIKDNFSRNEHSNNDIMEEKYTNKFVKKVLEIIKLLERDEITIYISIFLSANLALEHFEETIPLIERWLNDEDWKIRECSIHPMLSGLKKNRDKALEILDRWSDSDNHNYRRFVAESLRPKADIKWLRDPEHNDKILEIITKLNHDKSIYVRKAVGNNLKDLTKYMPDKILKLIEEWLEKKDSMV